MTESLQGYMPPLPTMAVCLAHLHAPIDTLTLVAALKSCSAEPIDLPGVPHDESERLRDSASTRRYWLSARHKKRPNGDSYSGMNSLMITVRLHAHQPVDTNDTATLSSLFLADPDSHQADIETEDTSTSSWHAIEPLTSEPLVEPLAVSETICDYEGIFKVLGNKIHVSGLRTLGQVRAHVRAFVQVLVRWGALPVASPGTYEVLSIQRIVANVNYTIDDLPDAQVIARHIKDILRGNEAVRHLDVEDRNGVVTRQPVVYWLPVDNARATKSSPPCTFYVGLADNTDTGGVLRRHNEVSYMLKSGGSGSITQSCPSWESIESVHKLFLHIAARVKALT